MDRLNQNSNGTTLHLILLSSSIIFIICFLLTQLVTVKVEISFLHFFSGKTSLAASWPMNLRGVPGRALRTWSGYTTMSGRWKRCQGESGRFLFIHHFSLFFQVGLGWTSSLGWSCDLLAFWASWHAIYKKKDDFFVCKSCKNHHLNVGPSGSFLRLMA